MSAIVLAVVLAQYTPQEAQALFVEANDAYYRGEYDVAQGKYERLLAAGLGGPDVLFNLGTTHLAAGRLGPAVLHLERARRLSADDDVDANLAVARQRQVDRVVGDEAAVPFTWRLAEAVDDAVVTPAFLAAWWLGFVLAWVAWRRAPGEKLLPGLLAAVLLLAGGVLGSAVAVQAHVRRTVPRAVVLAEAAPVREFPGESARVAFEVHAGLEVRVVESSGRWVRVRLPNALEGWTEKTVVEAL